MNIKKTETILMIIMLMTANMSIAANASVEGITVQENINSQIEVGQICTIGNLTKGVVVAVNEDGSFAVNEVQNGNVKSKAHTHVVNGVTTKKQKVKPTVAGKCYAILTTSTGKCVICKERVVTRTTENYAHKYVNGKCSNCGKKKR